MCPSKLKKGALRCSHAHLFVESLQMDTSTCFTILSRFTDKSILRFRRLADFYHGLLNSITTYDKLRTKTNFFLILDGSKGGKFWRIGISKHICCDALSCLTLLFADCSGLARATSAVSKYLSLSNNIPSRHPLSDFWDINVSVLSTSIPSSCRV
jgi:hypothetical protein